MKRVFVLAFVALAIVYSANATVKDVVVEQSNSTEKTRTSAEQEIIDLARAKWQWMSEKNVDKLAELFHNEAQFVHMGGYWGKEQELQTIRSGGIRYKEAEIHSEDVKFTKNTAVVYTRMHLKAVVGGREVRNPFIVSEVYVKERGKWQLSVLAFTKTMGQ